MLVAPVADGVKLTLQLEVPVAPAVRGQLDELKEPALPLGVKFTVPAGDVFVPAAEASVTVAVHFEAWLTTTGVSQATDVVVVRRFTVMLKAVVVELVLWVGSPP